MSDSWAMTNRLDIINSALKADALAFVEGAEHHYSRNVDAVVDRIGSAAHGHGHRIVMLAGHSASGKTTTAKMIVEKLKIKGINAHVVSFDNFFLGRGLAPLLPNGFFDYESIEAMNVGMLQNCLSELIRDGETTLPLFDFVTGKQSPGAWHLKIDHDDVVVFEGIHALNPVITSHLPEEYLIKLFICVQRSFYEADREILMARDIRLIRRIVRDHKFRASTPENTLQMWTQVCRGEEEYINPYQGRADMSIDSNHCYEPCIYAGEAIPLLQTVQKDNAYYPLIANILEQLKKFTPLSIDNIPETSLLREFVGGSIY